MIIAFLSAGFIVLLIVVVTLGIRCKNLEKWLMKSIEAGEELQERANENDLALRQGLEDQAEVYEMQLLDAYDREVFITDLFVEDADSYEKDLNAFIGQLELQGGRLTASEIRTNELWKIIGQLEVEHAFHADHCLPVLDHMRKAIA